MKIWPKMEFFLENFHFFCKYLSFLKRDEGLINLRLSSRNTQEPNYLNKYFKFEFFYFKFSSWEKKFKKIFSGQKFGWNFGIPFSTRAKPKKNEANELTAFLESMEDRRKTISIIIGSGMIEIQNQPIRTVYKYKLIWIRLYIFR